MQGALQLPPPHLLRPRHLRLRWFRREEDELGSMPCPDRIVVDSDDDANTAVKPDGSPANWVRVGRTKLLSCAGGNDLSVHEVEYYLKEGTHSFVVLPPDWRPWTTRPRRNNKVRDRKHEAATTNAYHVNRARWGPELAGAAVALSQAL